jgi:hypothetical protein
MFRLLKLCLSLAGFLAFAWFGMTVKLGDRTLFEHLHAIGQTKESKELVDGTKQAAGPLVDEAPYRKGERPRPCEAPRAAARRGRGRTSRPGEAPAAPPRRGRAPRPR